MVRRDSLQRLYPACFLRELPRLLVLQVNCGCTKKKTAGQPTSWHPNFVRRGRARKCQSGSTSQRHPRMPWSRKAEKLVNPGEDWLGASSTTFWQIMDTHEGAGAPNELFWR